jgi:hypothetical protein
MDYVIYVSTTQIYNGVILRNERAGNFGMQSSEIVPTYLHIYEVTFLPVR